MFQRPAAVIALLALATVLAGCVNQDEPPADATTPPTGGTSPVTTPTGGTGGTAPPPSKPANPEPVVDKGAIQGEFAKTWTMSVAAISPKALNVQFNLTGVQPGAPATASVYLVFSGPDGKALKTTTVGVGGSGEKVAWAFAGGDITQVGDYTLKAMSQPSPLPAPGGLPSGGVANYEMTMTLEY